MILQNDTIVSMLKMVDETFNTTDFLISNNLYAITAEVQSNLSVYLRSEDALKEIKEYYFNDTEISEEEIIEELDARNEELFYTVIYLSMLKNLTNNELIQKGSAKNVLAPIANTNKNPILAADGVQVVNDSELIISYVSTSLSSKVSASDGKSMNLNQEIENATAAFKDTQKLKKFDALNTLLAQKKRDFLLNVSTKDSNEFYANIIKIIHLKQECIKSIVDKRNLDNEVPSFKKHLKISISDAGFNPREMLKIYLKVKEALKNGELDSLILENIKTGLGVVFNKNKLNDYQSIFKEKFVELKDMYLVEEHKNYSRKFLSDLLLSKDYTDHFNLNALKTVNGKNIVGEITPIVIAKSKYETFGTLDGNYFGRMFEHLKNIKLFYEVEYMFDNDAKNDTIDEEFNKMLEDVLKFNHPNTSLIDILVMSKFVAETSYLIEDGFSESIFNKIVDYYQININKLLSDSPSPLLISILNSMNFNEKYLYFYQDTNRIVTSETRNTKEYTMDNEIIKSIETDPHFHSLSIGQTITQHINKESLSEEVLKHYFKELIDNNKELDENELHKLVTKFIDINFDGSVQKAIYNIYADTIVEKRFSTLSKEYERRIKEFCKRDNQNGALKHIVMIVDYDNDGTIAKLVAEKMAPKLKALMPKKYQTQQSIEIMFTKNDGVRGLSFTDYEGVVKNYSPDMEHEILVMTADNGTSNIAEIDKILNQEVYNQQGKLIPTTIDGVLINDHHPMLSIEENDIKEYYIKNYNKVLLFNPEYDYNFTVDVPTLERSHKKNISGASSLQRGLSFLVQEKDDKETLEYVQKLSMISNLMDYVDIEHIELSNPNETTQAMKIAKNMNLLQKFTIYFNNLMNEIDLKDFSFTKEDYAHLEKFSGENELIQKNQLARHKLADVMRKFDEPISSVGALFANHLLHDSLPLIELFENGDFDAKRNCITMIYEHLKELQPEYLKSIFKDVRDVEVEDINVSNLKKQFNESSFDILLKEFKHKYMDFTINHRDHTHSFNVEKLEKLDDEGRKMMVYVDHSIPKIPKKLIMDMARDEVSTSEHIVFYGIEQDGQFVGSARLNGNFILDNFKANFGSVELSPVFAGHSKAAGVSFDSNFLSLMRKNVPFSMHLDADVVEKYTISLSNVFDFETVLPSAKKINNRKVGGLEFEYSINFNDIKNVALNIEHLKSSTLEYLTKDGIKAHKNYSIIIDLKKGIKLNLKGAQLLEIIKKRDNEEPMVLNFKYFNNTYRLDVITPTISNPNHFKYVSPKKEYSEMLEKHLEIMDTLKTKPIKNEFLSCKLLGDTNILKASINIDALKKTKKQNADGIEFWGDFTLLMKSFGVYNGDISQFKNIKAYIEKLENYYSSIGKAASEMSGRTIKNFMSTDVETNGLEAPLTQIGHMIFEGDYDSNGNWKMSGITLLTSLIDYDKEFGVIPGIEKLTEIDTKLCKERGTHINDVNKLLLKEYPKANETLFMAHNEQFDKRMLKTTSNKEFETYINDCLKLDTVHLSKMLNTTGSYQLMSSLSVQDNSGNTIYLGLIPQWHTIINGQITAANKDTLKSFEYKTIHNAIIQYQNNNIVVTKADGTIERYTGQLRVKEGHDTRLSSVSENISAIFLNNAKENLKKQDPALEGRFKKAILDYINDEILTTEVWQSMNSSKRGSRTSALNIIDYHFVSPHFNNTLLLTRDRRLKIANDIEKDIKLTIRLGALATAETSKLFEGVMFNKDLTLIEKVNELLKNNGFIDQFAKNVKDLKEDRAPGVLIEYAKKLKEQDNITDFEANKFMEHIYSMVTDTKKFPEFKKFIIESMELKNMIIHIFDKSKGISSVILGEKKLPDNEAFKIIYDNAREQKNFFHLFVKNIKEIQNSFGESSTENSDIIKAIRNYIKNNEELNTLPYLKMDVKITLFLEFLKLNNDPYFSLALEELHNNFFSPFGDFGIEGAILPIIAYDKKMEELSEIQKKEVIEHALQRSNLNDLSSQLRDISFNSATNQFHYCLHKEANNMTISDKGITFDLKVDKILIKKVFTEKDLMEMFPQSAPKMIELMNGYLHTKDNSLKSELYSMFLKNTDVDVSMQLFLYDMSKGLNTKGYIERQQNLLGSIHNDIAGRLGSAPYHNEFFGLLQTLHADWKLQKENGQNYELPSKLFLDYLKEHSELSRMVEINANKGTFSWKGGKDKVLNNVVSYSTKNVNALFENLEKLDRLSGSKLMLMNSGQTFDTCMATTNGLMVSLQKFKVEIEEQKLNVESLKRDNLKSFVDTLGKFVKKVEFTNLYIEYPEIEEREYKKLVKLFKEFAPKIENSDSLFLSTLLKKATGMTLEEFKKKELPEDAKNSGFYSVLHADVFSETKETKENLKIKKLKTAPMHVEMPHFIPTI